LIQSNEKRASYNLETNTIDIGNQAGVDESVAHEMGHFIEYNNPIIKKECQEFYNNVTQGGEKRSLKKDLPDDDYDDDEFYIKTNIPLPFYATKCMNEGTELFSVGMQKLYENPIEFSRDYPEFFNFIVSTLRKVSIK
jgi:hypothetical protein